MSADNGVTPGELDLRFDVASMTYGENTASLVFRQQETEVSLPVRYDLLGSLTIGPSPSVTLGGIAGEPRSSVATLTVDSPQKAGLKWRAKTEAAWLVLEPTSGETPTTMSVSADLTKAGPNASGRIEFVADETWQGSPAVVPVALHTLAVSPAAFDHSERLGADPNVPPLQGHKLELRSSAPDESLGWTLSGAPPWLSVATAQGGTPTDVDLRFDLTSMNYGENVATLCFRHRDAERRMRLRYELLGALRIGPTQNVPLRGVVGAEKSSVVKLTVDSPVKPGLKWKAKCDDPWLVVEPTSGETPSTVSVHAILAKAASNASGRIEFTAESAWQGSPTVIPVVIEILNPSAVRKQIDAKVALIKSERNDTKRDLDRIAEALKTPRGVEAVIQSFREIADRAESGAARVSTLHQDLLGFLEQNAAYEEVAGFAEVRAVASQLLTDVQAEASAFKRCVHGIRTSSFAVHSGAEWQSAPIEVSVGDIIAFEASGTWKLGFMISAVGPEGLPTPSIQDSAKKGLDYGHLNVDPAHNHGCLLLRVGTSIVAAQASQGLARATESGAIEGRCNDTRYTDNKGSLTVRVAVIPSR
ncbi:MAG: hypothetical protein K8T90_08985 [Planctomycetes bacterium]|nr:hypothetical protein [Planctomycetota bacterium]